MLTKTALKSFKFLAAIKAAAIAAVRKAAARLMPSKLKTHNGQGRGRKPKG